MVFGSSKFFKRLDVLPSTILVGGYELQAFRIVRLSELLISTLPEFALKYSELQNVPPAQWANLLAKASKLVYKTSSFLRRGEVGEILLHMVMRDFFGTEPAITKIYYKDSPNDTVKGLDAVHVSQTQTGLSLAIGESKIYKKPSRAVASILKDFQSHLNSNFLRQEFMYIETKLDSTWPHSKAFQDLISKDRSLDDVFHSIQMFGLVAYDSAALGKHTESSTQVDEDVVAEISSILTKFVLPKSVPKITINLIFVPLHTKKQLLIEFDRKLKGLQTL